MKLTAYNGPAYLSPQALTCVKKQGSQKHIASVLFIYNTVLTLRVTWVALQVLCRVESEKATSEEKLVETSPPVAAESVYE